MSKILAAKIENNTFLVDCLVEQKEYNEFKERITSQVLKNVSVPGFRKGNAPEKLAMEKVDQIALQSTIMQETVQKFYAELQEDVDKKLVKEDRIGVSTTISVNPEHTKETEDGFQFRVLINLLPKIALDKISDIKVELPEAEKIQGRVSKKDFFDSEKVKLINAFNVFEEVDSKSKEGLQIEVNLVEKSDEDKERKQDALKINIGTGQFPADFEKNIIGLKKGDKKSFKYKVPHGDHSHEYNYEIEVLKVAKPTLTKINDVLEQSEEAKKQIKSEQDFEKTLQAVYDQETENLYRDIKKNAIVRGILDIVPDFDMESEKMDSEISRIDEVLTTQAKGQGKKLAEVFENSGLPGSEKKPKTDKAVRAEIEDYVKKEFKLMNILQAVYFGKVENKITEKEAETLEKQIKQSPQNFNLSLEDAKDDDRVKNVAYDRLLRSKAYTWIQDQVQIVTPGEKKKKATKAKKNT
jgi:trigger factor